MKTFNLIDVSKWTYTSIVASQENKALMLYSFLDDLGRVSSEFRVYSNTAKWEERKLELRSKVITESLNHYYSL